MLICSHDSCGLWTISSCIGSEWNREDYLCASQYALISLTDGAKWRFFKRFLLKMSDWKEWPLIHGSNLVLGFVCKPVELMGKSHSQG